MRAGKTENSISRSFFPIFLVSLQNERDNEMSEENTDNLSDSGRALLNRARAFCAGDEQCRSSVARKLVSWGVDMNESDAILNRLVSDGYIDERRYACAYCESKLLRAGWGERKVRYELRMKHLSAADIDAGIASVDEEAREEAMRRVAEKKLATLHGDSETMQRKLMAFMIQRGFNFRGL